MLCGDTDTFPGPRAVPDSHALEHLCVGVEGQNGGAAHAGAVQQAQRQALHEGQRGGLGGAVVYSPGDGRYGEDGVHAHHVAVAKLQHPGQEGLCGLGGGERREEGGQKESDSTFFFCVVMHFGYSFHLLLLRQRSFQQQ